MRRYYGFSTLVHILVAILSMTVSAAGQYSRFSNVSTCPPSTSTVTFIDYHLTSTRTPPPITFTVFESGPRTAIFTPPSVVHVWISANNSIPTKTPQYSGTCPATTVTTTIPAITVGDSGPMVIVTMLYGDVKTPPTVAFVDGKITTSERRLTDPMAAPTPMRKSGDESPVPAGQTPDPARQLYGAGTLRQPPIFEDPETASAPVVISTRMDPAAAAILLQSQVVPQGQRTQATTNTYQSGIPGVASRPNMEIQPGELATRTIMSTMVSSKESPGDLPKSSGGTTQFTSSADERRSRGSRDRLVFPILAIFLYL